MTSQLIKKTVALAAAAATTLVLFGAVVKIGENDKKALAAARAAHVQVATASTSGVKR
jgi:hypothetical protein